MSKKGIWKDRIEEIYRLRFEEKLSNREIGKRYGVSKDAIKSVTKRFHIPTLVKEKKIKPIKPKKEKRIWKTLICEYCGKEFLERPGKQIDKYCSQECSAKARKQQTILAWKENPSKGTESFTCAKYVREYMIEKVGYKCEKCGWGIENPYTHKVPLQIHHLDGNSLNNEESNLQVLCPNCHALTENFGSRNKNAPNGKSQYYRRA